MGDWIRVSRHELCPICGKHDWCGRTADGVFVICMRIENEKPTINGGWLYQVGDFPKAYEQVDLPPQGRRVKPDVLNEVYNAMLLYLSLLPKHREELLSPKRGMTTDQIKHRRYRSLTRDRSFVSDLANVCKLAGIPGFYRNEYGWRLAGANGLLIPVRDVYQRIIGFQIRPDDRGLGKYLWLSSRGKPSGTGSGSPSHLAVPIETKTGTQRLWITEGALKADITCDLLDQYVIGVPGVAAWRKSLYMLDKLKPSRVIIAYDMDGNDNKHVNVQCRRLTRAIRSKGYKVGVALWDTDYKGIDDALLANRRIRVKASGTDRPCP